MGCLMLLVRIAVSEVQNIGTENIKAPLFSFVVKLLLVDVG